MFNSGEKKFFVNSGDNNFSDRQKNIFAKLDAAVEDNEPLVNPKQHNNNESFVDCKNNYRSHFSNPNKRLKLETKHFRGKESIFKRPEAPPPARVKRDIPDHKRNPHKWTKYSLSDVSPEDMSDQSNTTAALSFMKELKSRKELMGSMDIDDSNAQILFKCPTKFGLSSNEPKFVKTESSDFPTQDEGPCFRSSKLIMPEYVVGQKKFVKKYVKRNTEKDHVIKEIKLDHLAEEEEDDYCSE